MERHVYTKNGEFIKPIERDDVDNFIVEILEVCLKYGMSISHEDCHGGFIIDKYSDHYAEWFANAGIEWSLLEDDEDGGE